MKKKRTRINWKNVCLAIILLLCTSIVLYDLFMLTIYSWITGVITGWSLIGFLTFLLAFVIGGEILEYFIEESK